MHCAVDQTILSGNDREVKSDCCKATQGACKERDGEHPMVLGGYYAEEHA
jgi:hypothetical protein